MELNVSCDHSRFDTAMSDAINKSRFEDKRLGEPSEKDWRPVCAPYAKKCDAKIDVFQIMKRTYDVSSPGRNSVHHAHAFIKVHDLRVIRL